ncbi:hypothetical protein [Paraglaciecola sp. 25GB23A]|uniref:hypothetical protein n=1 Tax=Paraglaciecola sp. 25GB23A TaxID=3156068 RepID=UPI0032AF4531
MSGEQNQQTSTEEELALRAQIERTVDSVGGLIAVYQQRFKSQYNLAQKEWVLSKQSAALILLLTLILSAMISTLWLITNGVIGSLLYKVGCPLWGLGSILLLFNVGIIIGLWQTIKTLIQKIGFSRLISSFSD